MAHIMRTHHNLAEVAGRYKDASLLLLARALTSYIDVSLNGGEEQVNENMYKTAHYDPIVLGFILGRTWPVCQEEVLAAIAADLDYDRMLVQVSPRAEAKVVKGIDVSKLEFRL